jgi:WD40 repeat protein
VSETGWSTRRNSRGLQNDAGVTNSGACSILEGASIADVQHLMSQGGRILAKGCTPNGRYLVTTATDQTVRILDTTGPQQSELVGLQGAATRLSFAPDSLHFRTTDVWGTVVDWDLSGANRGRSAAVLSGHKAVVTAIAFAREAPLLATGSRDGEIRLWTITGRELGNPISTGEASVVALQLSSDGTHIGSITSDGAIQSWGQFGEPEAALSISTGDQNIIDAVFRADGLAAATAIAGGAARIYDLASRKSAFVPRAAYRVDYGGGFQSHREDSDDRWR